MRKPMTIQQQIEALKKDFETKIAELEKQAKAEEKTSKVWKPNHNDRVYMIHADGVSPVFFNEESEAHKCAYIRGNIFKRQGKAEWEDMHRIVATELKHFVQENDPNPITEEDWNDYTIDKHYIYYDFEEGIVCSTDDVAINANQIYASELAVLRRAIEHIGEERLKKYYFGVK